MSKETSENLAKEVLDAAEMALYLGMSESFVRRLVRENRIPFNKIGGRVVFFLPVVREWLTKNAIQPRGSEDVSLVAYARNSADHIWNKAQGGDCGKFEEKEGQGK